MTLTADRDGLRFDCDGCADFMEYTDGEDLYDDALPDLKEEGWVSRWNGNEFEHFCEACK